jgi:hypothetical protein
MTLKSGVGRLKAEIEQLEEAIGNADPRQVERKLALRHRMALTGPGRESEMEVVRRVWTRVEGRLPKGRGR